MKIDWLKSKFQVVYSFFSSFFVRRKAYLAFVGYILLFFFSFLFSILFTFPYEELKNRIVYEVSARGYGKLSIESISFVPIIGLKFSDISFSRYNNAQKVEIFKGEKLIFKPSIISMMLGRMNIKFYGELYGGKVTGSYKVSDKINKIVLNLNDVNIGDYSALKTYFKIGVSGKFNGKVKLEGNIANLRDSDGMFEVNLTDFRLEESDAGFFKIPGVIIKSITGSIILEGGKIKSDGLSFNGGDLEGNINGEVVLRYPIATSLLNLLINIRFSDQFYEKIKAFVEPLNLKKDQGGFYILNVGGTLIFPRLR